MFLYSTCTKHFVLHVALRREGEGFDVRPKPRLKQGWHTKLNPKNPAGFFWV